MGVVGENVRELKKKKRRGSPEGGLYMPGKALVLALLSSKVSDRIRALGDRRRERWARRGAGGVRSGVKVEFGGGRSLIGERITKIDESVIFVSTEET